MSKKENHSQKKLIVILLFLLVVSGTIGFAAIQTTLQINGTAKMQAASWEIKFENLSEPLLVGSASVETPPILNSSSIDSFSFHLLIKNPGDSITYTFDVINSGILDAKIGTFLKATSLICEGENKDPIQVIADETLVCDGLSYTLTYTDTGTAVAEGDTLKRDETKNMTLALTYNGSGHPLSEVNISGLGITMIYVQDK